MRSDRALDIESDGTVRIWGERVEGADGRRYLRTTGQDRLTLDVPLAFDQWQAQPGAYFGSMLHSKLRIEFRPTRRGGEVRLGGFNGPRISAAHAWAVIEAVIDLMEKG